MEKIITSETIHSFAYINDGICKKPIKGVVLSFLGLGEQTRPAYDTQDGEFYAANGILYVIPYTDPWAWMNRQAVAYTDEILDVLFEMYHLPVETPVVSTGRSMGGQAALVYMARAKRTPVACVANCPVCDVPFHFTERPDLPRTLYSALFHEEGTMEQALQGISPLHLIDELPRVNYHIFHCRQDAAVNKQLHSDRLVAKMETRGFQYTYDIIEGRPHCELTLEMKRKFEQYVVAAITG